MEIIIRLARLDEADLLTGLSMRSKQSNGYDDAFMAACREELTVTAQRMQQGEYWVAETDSICGCVCLDVDPDSACGEVHAFFIDPDCQRQGIGKCLWLEIKKRAETLKLKTLVLDADPAAVPFYLHLGFEITGEVTSGSIAGRRLPKMTYTFPALMN